MSATLTRTDYPYPTMNLDDERAPGPHRAISLEWDVLDAIWTALGNEGPCTMLGAGQILAALGESTALRTL